MIWADFGDPGADLPPQNLCNSLGFSWSGQVVRGQCVRHGISAISKKCTGIIGKSINSQIFVILWGKSMFPIEIAPRDPSESLIFLRNY